MTSIGVGVIGTGFGAKIQAPAFQAIPGVRIVGVAGRDSWRDLIDDDRVTAVSVAVPPAAHCEIVKCAVQTGKHVLCEKPFGLTVAQATDMLESAREAGVIHMVDFLFRTAPERVRLRELLHAKALGRILRVNVEWTMRGRAARNSAWCWQVDPTSGGGVLFSFGSHVIDYLEWLLGPVRSVSSRLSVCGHRPSDSLGRAVAEDTVDALMMIGDDLPVSLSISNAMPGARGHWLSIYGEHGSLVVGSSNLHDAVLGTALFQTGTNDNELRRVDVEPLETSVPDGRLLLFGRVAAAFVEAIRSGRPVSPSFEDGRRAQVVAQAVRQAHDRQAWVAVDA